MSARKSNAFIIISAAAVFVTVFLVTSFLSKSKPAGSPLPQFNQIVLDAGHGGVDGGAKGINGVWEKSINLQITLSLRDMLVASGHDVVLTRDKDESKHDEDITKISKFKKSDMKNRLKIITKNPNSLTVSIHQNTYSSAKQKGAQIFYSENNPLSQELAQCIQDGFVANLQPDNKRKIKPANGNYYLLENSNTPTVLAECGFLTNYEEAALLNTEEYRNKVAFTIYCAIIQFLEDYSY